VLFIVNLVDLLKISAVNVWLFIYGLQIKQTWTTLINVVLHILITLFIIIVCMRV